MASITTMASNATSKPAICQKPDCTTDAKAGLETFINNNS